VSERVKWTYIRRDIREAYLNEIMALKMKSLFVNGVIIDYNRFCAGTGIPFSANEYMYISTGGTRGNGTAVKLILMEVTNVYLQLFTLSRVTRKYFAGFWI
jgi:hypothetical protein